MTSVRWVAYATLFLDKRRSLAFPCSTSTITRLDKLGGAIALSKLIPDKFN